MDIATIQACVDAIAAAMLEKGLAQAEAEFAVQSHKGFGVSLRWVKPKGALDRYQYKFFPDETIEGAITKADAFVASLPDRETAKLHEFMAALGGVIDLGRENNIEVEFLNPLVETAKRLSENALTYRGEAA